jgi:hypothetical protein
MAIVHGWSSVPTAAHRSGRASWNHTRAPRGKRDNWRSIPKASCGSVVRSTCPRRARRTRLPVATCDGRSGTRSRVRTSVDMAPWMRRMVGPGPKRAEPAPQPDDAARAAQGIARGHPPRKDGPHVTPQRINT